LFQYQEISSLTCFKIIATFGESKGEESIKLSSLFIALSCLSSLNASCKIKVLCSSFSRLIVQNQGTLEKVSFLCNKISASLQIKVKFCLSLSELNKSCMASSLVFLSSSN